MINNLKMYIIDAILQRLVFAVIPDIRCSFENKSDVPCTGLIDAQEKNDSGEQVEPWVKVTAAANTPSHDHTMGNSKSCITVLATGSILKPSFQVQWCPLWFEYLYWRDYIFILKYPLACISFSF